MEQIQNNKWKNIVAIITMLAVAYSTVTYAKSFANSQYSPTTFTVIGEGKEVIVPDTATFTFSVITEGGSDLAKSQKDNTEKVNRAIAFVKSSGIDAKDIKTAGYNVSPRYDYGECGKSGCPAPKIAGYTVNQTVEVKARNFDKVGEILAGVVTNGANSVSELQFKVDDETEIQNKARATAIAQAKEKAQAIAKAGNFKLGEITSLYEEIPYTDANYGMGMGGAERAQSGGGSSAPTPTIEPGATEVTVKMNVTYEIR